MAFAKIVFILAILFCLSPFGSPPIALALGLILAFIFGNPYPAISGKPTKYLLQASVVLLGFGMNLRAIYEAGKDGIAFTIVTIFGTLAAGWVIGRLLGVPGKTSALVSSGTAICGGSAIAAVGPAINAEPKEMSVSLGTVFVLNAVALFLFPLVGSAMGLSQEQFGVWAAIAIHDTSSVVGAGQAYGDTALATATTVKLARALWIAPLALLFAWLYRSEEKHTKPGSAIPWFIFLFIGAAAIRTFAPPIVLPSIFDSLVNLAKAGMTVTLFLIGVSLTPRTLKDVGSRPLFQGLLLWAIISVTGLVAVLKLL